MGCKKYRNQIFLLLYDELQEKEKAGLEEHLRTCQNCARELSSTREAFGLLDKSKQASFPEPRWDKTWRIIKENIERKPEKRSGWAFSPRWAFAAAAVLMVFVLGILVGRRIFTPQPEIGVEQVSLGLQPVSYQTALKAHFEELEPLLIDIANSQTSEVGTDTVLVEKDLIRGLLIQNMLLKKVIAGRDPATAQILDDLDIFLTEVANLKSDDRQTPALLKDFIQERGVLFKMKVLQKS